jgi:formate/nitrite transporter FocA (FNT family)
LSKGVHVNADLRKETASFDVILVDWMMPGFHGMDVVEEIHRVANMYFIPTGILLRNGVGFTYVPGIDLNLLSWVNFLWRNLLPVTIGNIIGGVVFVGMSYWGAYLRPVKSDS